MSTNQRPDIMSSAAGLGVEKDYTPEEIVAHGQWNDQQKLERLEKLKMDAIALQRAESEGMEGGEKMDLRAIERAIEAVKGSQSAADPGDGSKVRPEWTSGVQ